MRRVAACVLCVALAACGDAPAPPASQETASQPHPQEQAGADVTAPPRSALPPPEPAPDEETPEPVTNDLGTGTADAWVGDWVGPEGTSLRVVKEQIGYEVTVTGLDGPRSFHAFASDEVLQFERDGVLETVRAGDGKATGMKWLEGESNCLVVKAGEGYCRD